MTDGSANSGGRSPVAARFARLAVQLDGLVEELVSEPLDELRLAAPAAHVALSLNRLEQAFLEAEAVVVTSGPPPRAAAAPRAARRGQADDVASLIEVLTDEFGAPIIAPRRPGLPGLRYFACPVCGGGIGDHSLLPYRPLTVSDDGRVWCAGMFDCSWARASCSFTPERLHRALDRMRAAAA